MTTAIKRFLLPALWLVVIFILTSLPAAILPEVRVRHVDKMVHFLIYLPLGFLLARSFRKAGAGTLVYAVGLCLVAASCDELHQVFIPGRSADSLDFLADLAGSITGAALWLAAGRLARR